jgi:hypothetical protein
MDSGRRRLLQWGLALCTLTGSHRARAEPLSPGLRSVQGLLASWDALGWQWTGTDPERAGADWLARVLSETGLDVAVERYPFQRVEVAQCRVESGAHHAPGLPLFDGGATDAAGVTGRLTLAGEDGDIAVLEAAPWEVRPEGLERAREDGRYRAVIVLTRGSGSGLAPLDCANPVSEKPRRKPVVQLGSEHRDWLWAGAAEHAEATLVAHFERQPGEGRNVVAVWTGTRPALPPLVVLAGRSGWGPCVGERGGGLVAMVYAAQALAQVAAQRTVIFAATSGCELGDMGLAAFLRRYPKLSEQALGWIELGRNLGARERLLRVSGGQASWLALLEARLAIEEVRYGAAEPPATDGEKGPAAAVPTTQDERAPPLTEAKLGDEKNAPGATLGPTHPGLFLEASAAPAYHLPTDQLPGAIDLAQTLALAKAFAETLSELTLV